MGAVKSIARFVIARVGLGAWYDWIDAFFVPFAGMATATRPGPDVRIYARRTHEIPRRDVP